MPKKNSATIKGLSKNEAQEYEIKLEQAYYRNEYLHYELYSNLAKSEKHADLKRILTNLSKKELEHRGIWAKELRRHGVDPEKPFTTISVLIFKTIRQLFGIAFMIKLLESEEESILKKYQALLDAQLLSSHNDNLLKIIRNEKKAEDLLLRDLQRYEGSLYYIKSIIFGLNDGLVEVLAVVSGLAALAVGSSSFVAVAGFIVAISGSLSMAAGAYLAARSEDIVSLTLRTDGRPMMKKSDISVTHPAKEAYYTGLFYFLGTLVPIAPFAFGFNGYVGIALAMVLTAVVLIVASIVVSVIGEESVPKRILEMLSISFGAAILTTVIGTLARIYLGVSI